MASDCLVCAPWDPAAVARPLPGGCLWCPGWLASAARTSGTREPCRRSLFQVDWRAHVGVAYLYSLNLGGLWFQVNSNVSALGVSFFWDLVRI